MLIVNPETNNIKLFSSLFKARDDVFALHWQKGKKSGYAPAWYFDPYHYKVHKIKGGTFQNYPDKQYLPFTDEQLAKHLNGTHLIGVYPLLQDNTSWFIAADFDEQNWEDECRKFIRHCHEKEIPAYLERSRSGKGGHVWIFFERPYPANRSRKIMMSLLMECAVISLFDKNSSFDRLFPNQDSHSGKGFGNLIALPFYKPAFERGNSCFIDPETYKSLPNQWSFLADIKKVDVKKLDAVYQSLSLAPVSNKSFQSSEHVNELCISLGNIIKLNRSAIPLALINFLKEELNFTNSEFVIKTKIGRNTFGTERYFRFVEETESEVIVPRGFAGKLLRFCRDYNIPYVFKEERRKSESTVFQFNSELRDYQKVAINAVSKKDMGVIVAPPGSGKTIIGLKMIAERQQPALIVVHRKQLLAQWIERIETFLKIPAKDIGVIGEGKSRIGGQITVATIQTLIKEFINHESDKIRDAFGTIIIDECHHVPAETYRNVVQQMNCYYLYGLTATPFRKYNDGKLIFIHLGDIITEITPQQAGKYKQATIIIRNTELDIPFNSKTDRFETLSNILIHDSTRNKLILKDITKELDSGNKVVIITERKEHIESLHQYLKQSYETITLSGEDTENHRAAKWKILKSGDYQVLITTGQFFGEGTDLENANCLFLVYPFSFEGKLIQYIGRVQRSEITPTVYDYRDIKIDYLNKLFLKRNVIYRKLEKQASLFEDPIEEPIKTSNIITIQKEIKISIELLEFRYGSVAIKYFENEANLTIEFEIGNENIRPEFEVLKPYFAKALKSKTIEANIYAEIENGQLVSQLASSSDLDRINREIVEGVRFRFVAKHFLGKLPPVTPNDSSEVNQMQSDHSLYESGEELLEEILKQTKFKHHKQLRWLAENHASHVLKVRFVLYPFSFVFLLEGEQQFHIILETLDTEEATYLWRFDKDLSLLSSQLKEIDKHLDFIQKDGRQAFLLSPPPNFGRIIHDYSDNSKGFILWKDALVEVLI